MDLKDTYDMMVSTDYKDRFRAEYHQLKLRCEGLRIMLEKYEMGTLPFTPACSFGLLNSQLTAMEVYKSKLEDRAKLEDIKL